MLREAARRNLQQYTDKMTQQMIKKRKLVDFKVGDFVRVNIPKIDRFAIDRPNLPCKILEKTREDRYKLGCKFGVISVCYSSSELEALGAITYPELNEIPSDEISIREAARLQSVGMMSGSICSCKGSCDNKRCRCRKVNAKCTSRCHSGRPCLNKE